MKKNWTLQKIKKISQNFKVNFVFIDSSMYVTLISTLIFSNFHVEPHFSLQEGTYLKVPWDLKELITTNSNIRLRATKRLAPLLLDFL